MALGRIAVVASGQILYNPFRQKISTHLVNRVVPMIVTSIARHLSTIKLTNNLSLITGDKRSVKVENLKLTELQNRPLVVLLSWLMAKPKHIHKFANYYIDKGFDVLSVNTSPWQLLWPVKGTQVIAGHILNFLDINLNYQPIIIHGFSAGAYQWGEVLVQIAKNKDRYKNVLNRVYGHIWDSVGDVSEVTTGVPKGLFPNNAILQNALQTFISFYLNAFDKITTQHFTKSSEIFRSDIIKSPAQFFLSESDVVVPIASSERVRKKWEDAGIEVYWKVWKQSPHVGHFYFHTEEYLEQLDTFLRHVGIPQQSVKLQSKL